MKTFSSIILLSILTLFIISCDKKENAPVNPEYIKKVEEHRKAQDDLMKNDPQSPFNAKEKVEFHPLNYFQVDESFVFKSKLYPYDKRESIPVFGTKGEERSAYRLGYLKFNKNDKEYRLNVYANIGQGGKVYHSTWFTDQTTSNETYDVGRYLEFEFNDNMDFVYTIDFNLAFNPYCAYSPNYSCAIPLDEDFLDLRITAGEMKFHE